MTRKHKIEVQFDWEWAREYLEDLGGWQKEVDYKKKKLLMVSMWFDTDQWEIQYWHDSNTEWNLHKVFRQNILYSYDDWRRKKALTKNDLRLVLDYKEGKIVKCKIKSDFYNLQKKWIKYLYGLDISPWSHLFLEFIYSLKDDHLILDEIQDLRWLIYEKHGDFQNYIQWESNHPIKLNTDYFIFPETIQAQDWWFEIYNPSNQENLFLRFPWWLSK